MINNSRLKTHVNIGVPLQLRLPDAYDLQSMPTPKKPKSPSKSPKPSSAEKKAAEPAGARRRLPPNEREFLIVQGAVAYFAEVGFEGQTRELARRLGITVALLFRYFPTKEDLVERVYQQVYLGRWRPEWETGLRDRSVPFKLRLQRFYRSYLEAIYTYEWIRIFFFAGLRGVNINQRYLEVLATRIVDTICIEVRNEYRLPTPDQVPIADLERDAVWGLQGQILYIGVRRYIYDQQIENPEAIVDANIEVFLSGICAVARASAQPRKE